MNKKIKMLIGSLMIIGLAFGIFSFVNLQIKMIRAINQHNYQIYVMDTFLSETFPEESSAFIQKYKK